MPAASVPVLVVSVGVVLHPGGARVAAAVQPGGVVVRVLRTVVVAVVSDMVERMFVVVLVVALLVMPRVAHLRVAHPIVWAGVSGQQDVADVEHLERGQAPELILEAVPEFSTGLGRRCREQRRARDHGQGDERPTSGPAACRVHGVPPHS